MLYIEELENGVIDLNGGTTHYEFNVVSKTISGAKKQFSVDFVSSEFIEVNTYGLNSLSIDVDINEIANEEFVILKNTLNEKVEIKITPNSYVTMEKQYKFKITKKTYEEDGSLKIKILSKINDTELGWKCTYDGRPMNYIITPNTYDSSCFVTIKPNVEVVSEFEAVVEFTQDESGNVIRLNILNTPNGIKKAD